MPPAQVSVISDFILLLLAAKSLTTMPRTVFEFMPYLG